MADAVAKEIGDLHAKVIAYVQEATDASQEMRELAEKCRDYYDGYQTWTEEELKKLQKRQQPAITVNRIKPKVDTLLGIERQMRTVPKGLPRNPDVDQDGANAVTESVRFVCDRNDWDGIRSAAFENFIIEGFGGAEVVAKKARNKWDIEVNHLLWDRLFFDPHSRDPDVTSDALYWGQFIWLDHAMAVERWPKAEDILDEALQRGSDEYRGDTYRDKPIANWVDPKRKRIRVAAMEYRDGDKIMTCIFTVSGFITEPKQTAYQDEDGNDHPSYILQSAFIDREGNRYGHVKQELDIQDELNKRRSKFLHLINTRQVRADAGAVDSVSAAKKELAKPNGWIETNPGHEFQILPTGDMAASQFQLYVDAKQEMDAVGSNASMSGKQKGDLSGRALRMRQQAGLTEVGLLFDRKHAWEERIYRAIWYRVRQFWTEEMWIRVTDNERYTKFIGLNQKIRIVDLMAQEAAAQGIPFDPKIEAAKNPAVLAETPIVKNNVATLDVDVIMDDAPDVATVQQEEFEILTQLAQTRGDIPTKAIIEASNLRNKDKLLEEMGAGAPNPKAQALQEKQTDLALRAAAAKVSKDEADANAKNAAAEIDKIRAALMARHAIPPGAAGAGAAGPMPMPNGGVIQ